MNGKKLYRNQHDKKLLGVCSGLADYFDIDPTIIRLIWVFLVFFAGVGFFAYLVCALIMPTK